VSDPNDAERVRRERRVQRYRSTHADADAWAVGYGPIEHDVDTQDRVFALADALAAEGRLGDGVAVFELLQALDRVTSAAMWLVVHETYAARVHLDGRDLSVDDFKVKPEGHTGGALNMVPAYAGYLAANALAGLTRSWIMGQGHTVAAIDSCNLLVGNMTDAHAARYSVTDEGLTRYVGDFYSYQIGEDGHQDSPLGSHVNAHTAGGLAEGGYLGFTELQYVHMPLPGEHLVAFLSDGAFEEQRGSDWAPRWWRPGDSGLVAPFMIANGRRIDQRTTMSQVGGIDWFHRHLHLNSFDPMEIDGRDPAAFAWAIFELEARLEAAGVAAQGGSFPVALPYCVAVAPKGAGFYGEGTNLAHNLPLPGNPHTDTEARALFNEHARRLWVPPAELGQATSRFQQHEESGRPRERDHPLAVRDVRLHEFPPLRTRDVPVDRGVASTDARSSPMTAIDGEFLAICGANPHLRPRVGNPDEMRSNRMQRTLDALEFRVTDPEPGLPESIDGAVVTALNEEAVVSAALANTGGINIVVTYEAFGAKMHGAVRQEIIFAAHQAASGRPPGWLSVPLVLTSHTWENAKNEQSHQDPAMAEAMLGETSDVSRVLFVPDANTAAVSLRAVYQTHGQVWTLVVPKSEVPDQFGETEAVQLVANGVARLDWAGHDHDRARVILTAIGAFQLDETLRASARLADRGVAHTVVYALEPGRMRAPRSDGEAAGAAPPEVVTELYPRDAPARVFVTHTRPEPMLGTLAPLSTGADTTAGLGFVNVGGTLTTRGLLFVNRCSWAHVVAAAARVADHDVEQLLTADERDALGGRRSPEGVII
jgi:phosphoketolase